MLYGRRGDKAGGGAGRSRLGSMLFSGCGGMSVGTRTS